MNVRGVPLPALHHGRSRPWGGGLVLTDESID
jgi:hypothetical protein